MTVPPASIHVACMHCGQRIEIPSTARGKVGICPICGNDLVVHPSADFDVLSPLVNDPLMAPLPSGPLLPPAVSATNYVEPRKTISDMDRFGLPWQRDLTTEAFLTTSAFVLTSPAQAFATMRRKGPVTNALNYLIVAALIANLGAAAELCVIRLVTEFVYDPSVARFDLLDFREFDWEQALLQFGLALLGAGAWAIMVATVGAWFWALLAHFLLIICDSEHADVYATHKIVVFGSGAVFLLMLIPFIGPVLAALWLPVVLFHGFVEAHECRGGTAILVAVLSFPMAAFFTLPILLVGSPDFMHWLAAGAA